MLISLNWLSDYIDIDLSVEKISEILTDIGLEIEGVETKESIKGGLKGLIVGEVLECQKHDNADKLKVCKVDVGDNESLQIVCGAPNVAKGQKVVVATVDTIIHPTEGDPFTIKKAKIRGVSSAGMICAEDEIGLGTDHDGILVLDKNTEVGTALTDLYDVKTDTVFEIGLTPNRSDAQSHLGVARDLAAAIQTQLVDEPVRINWPDVSGFHVDEETSEIKVEVENLEACPRYAGVVISEIKIKESPEWLKQRLESIGVKAINNVVDITNFINHEYGQPLHAFDYDKIKGKQIIVKNATEGELFTTLDQVERTLSAEDLMICNASESMCIGGVYGGLDSGVTDRTVSIFLESAYFDPRTIRRTELRHGLRTDAAAKFEKGVDPTKQVEVLKRAALLIKDLAEGQITSEIIDIYPEPIERKEVDLTFEKLRKVTGVDFDNEKVVDILRHLDFESLAVTETSLRVAVPQYRNDVTREADVIEEVLRIYGFNNVPLSGHTSFALSYQVNEQDALRNKLSDMLSGKGFHEIITNSITKKKYYDSLGAFNEQEFVLPLNSLNAEFDLLRPDMLMTGLEVIAHNVKRNQSSGAYYDFGNVYAQKGSSYIQNPRLAIYLTGNQSEKSWLSHKVGYNFFHVKKTVQEVLEKVGFTSWKEVETKNPLYAYGIDLIIKKKCVATLGVVHKTALKLADISDPVFYADIDFSFLLHQKPDTAKFTPISKFPSVQRDLALVIDKSVTYKSVANIAKQHGGSFFQNVQLFDVFEDENKLGKGKKSYAISLHFANPEKTLTSEEIDQQIEKMIGRFEKDLQATIRS